MSFNDLAKKEAAAKQASQSKDPKEQAAAQERLLSEAKSDGPLAD